MMPGPLARFWSDRSGAAAAEMALVTPLLLGLMFGAMEIGKYFLDQHVVIKAVRDGARYAARQNFSKMSCSTGVDATVETQIKNLVRYGKPVVTGADKPRLFYWTNPSTITVTLNCYTNTGGTVYGGVYNGMANFPRVKVAASVPYVPLVGAIGFDAPLSLNASNQAAVMGI